MPVITFLSDLFSLTQGAKYRLVGRHTQKYSLRIADRSRNHPVQQRILLIALAGADEWVSEALLQSSCREKPSKSKVATTMRSYMSALLILLGNRKKALLHQLDYSERQWMDLWCQVFEYQPDDMLRFDTVFLEAYRSDGVEGLLASVQKSTATEEVHSLRDSLAKDLTALAKVLNLGKECECE
jgi:hypothetical protein